MGQKLLKELGVGILNGLVLSVLIFIIGYFLYGDLRLSLTISLSLLTVIIFAAIYGTVIPLLLDKYNIDPAIATGPFITTSNDIIGLFIYFSISRFFYA
jgi:magnesium transporter